jgi:hypothetical protein
MTMSKETHRVEGRLIELQNAVAILGAKLDALLSPDAQKRVVLPEPIPALAPMMSQPYMIKPSENPASTIAPPVVLPEGQTVPQKIEETAEKINQSTIEIPVVDTSETEKSELEKALGTKPAMTPAPNPAPAPESKPQTSSVKPSGTSKLPEEPLV